MAEKTKAELAKEAEKLGVEVEAGDTKADIAEAVEEKKAENLPDVFEARFDRMNPSTRPKTAKKGDKASGPDASAGVGGMPAAGTGTGGTAGTVTGGGTVR